MPLLDYVTAAYKNYVHGTLFQVGVCCVLWQAQQKRARPLLTPIATPAQSQKLLARGTPPLQEIGCCDARGLTVVITGPTRWGWHVARSCCRRTRSTRTPNLTDATPAHQPQRHRLGDSS
jgi:hypothetical protein